MKTNSCLNTAYYVELQKMKGNKETILLFSMSLLPVFYSGAFALHSTIVQYVGSEKSDFLTYVMALTVLGAIALIFHVIFAFYTAGFLAREISSGSALLYIPRYRDRKSIFLAKSLSLQTQLAITALVFFLVCVPCYILVNIMRPDSFNGRLFPADHIVAILSLLLSVWISFSITIELVLYLCSYVKFVPAMGIFLGVCILWNVFEGLPFLQLLSPYFYIMDLEKHIPSYGIAGSPSFPIPVLLILNLILAALYIVPSYFLGSRKFCRRDLA